MCERLALLLWIQWRILWISSKGTNVRISLLWLVLASVLPVEYLTSGNHVLCQVSHHRMVKHLNLFTFSYSATTRTGAPGRRLSNHNIFKKQKILKLFLANGPIKFKVQPCNCWKLYNHLNSGNSPQIHESYRSVCKKSWKSFFFFQKLLWLDNLLPSAPVRFNQE